MVGGIVGKIEQAKLLQKVLPAFRGVFGLHASADKCDAPVTERVQMPHRQTRAADQVAVDADAVKLDAGRADGSDRHVQLEPCQRVIEVAPVGGPDAAHEQYAVHTLADQLVHQLAGDGLVIPGLKEADGITVGLGFPICGVIDAHKVEIGHGGQHDGQRSGFSAFQMLGGGAGGIGKGINHSLHPVPRGGFYARIAAGDTGDCCGGYAGLACDVIDGYFSGHNVLSASQLRGILADKFIIYHPFIGCNKNVTDNIDN